MSITHSGVEIAFVNNGEVSKKTNKAYYSLKWKKGGELCGPVWARAGQLDGIRPGQVGDLLLSDTGDKFIAFKANGTTAPMGTSSHPAAPYRMKASPDEVDGKCVFGAWVAMLSNPGCAMNASSVLSALQIASTVYFDGKARGWFKNSMVTTGTKAQTEEELNDSVPY